MNNFIKCLELLKEKSENAFGTLELVSSLAIDQRYIDDARSVFGNEIKIRHTLDNTVKSGLIIKYGGLLIDSTVAGGLKDLSSNIENQKFTDKDIFNSLKNQIDDFNYSTEVKETGTVLEIKDGICKIDGLIKCMSQEIIIIDGNITALAFDLLGSHVLAVILANPETVKVGMQVERTHKIMSIGVSEEVLGRVIDSLGNPKDGKGDIKSEKLMPLEKIAPGVMSREPVTQPLQTGIKAIDALIPIGKGQRELILGDRQTGKTTIALDTIINQKGKNVLCIYVSIGQKESKLAQIVSMLEEKGAMEYTCVVSAGASESAAMSYLAPYSGVSIAEYFAEKGKDVLIVYDDLTKQAIAYREMSLLMRRPPGREAYPGDVFYLHSRLLERACNLNEEHGGGSITAIPIIETQGNDSSAYIPTNVISITDGQIYLESELFYKGVKPAINVGASVSRVGGAAQTKAMKKTSGSLKLGLAQFRDLEAFSQFSSELDLETKKQIDLGRRLTEILKQKQLQPLSVAGQILSIFAVSRGHFNMYELSEIATIESALNKFTKENYSEIYDALNLGQWQDDTEANLNNLLVAFKDYMLQQSN